jgi:hypothetical protein
MESRFVTSRIIQGQSVHCKTVEPPLNERYHAAVVGLHTVSYSPQFELQTDGLTCKHATVHSQRPREAGCSEDIKQHWGRRLTIASKLWRSLPAVLHVRCATAASLSWPHRWPLLSETMMRRGQCTRSCWCPP